MTPLPRFRSSVGLLAAGLLLASGLFAAPPSARIAFHSVASPQYAPPLASDGTVSPQTYTLIDGGYAAGTARDGKLAKLEFAAIAAPLEAALQSQGFRPAAPDQPALLHLIVEWGRTKPDISMNLEISANRAAELKSQRDTRFSSHGINLARDDMTREINGEIAKARLGAERSNATVWDNAQLLGYDDALAALRLTPRLQKPRKRQEELLNDLTSERLYVILRAFAFDTGEPDAAPQARLLWLTRLSIRDQGPSFPAQLEIMLPFAARYFGRNTHELIRATSLKDFER